MLGPSGSGKTTCLRMIAGFEHADRGTRSTSEARTSRGCAPYERDVNTVFQDYALFPHMTVADNVGYGLMVRKVPRAERRARSPTRSRWSGCPSREAQAGPAVGRPAAAGRPRACARDAPAGAAARRAARRPRPQAPPGDADRAEAHPAEVGLTFIYVTHDQEEALTMSDRLAVFNHGRIEQVGSPADVYEQPATAFVAGFVGVSNVLEGDVASAVDRRSSDASRSGPRRSRCARPTRRSTRTSTAQPGTSSDVVYLGAVTRYIVELERGGRLVVLAAEPGDRIDGGARGER